MLRKKGFLAAISAILISTTGMALAVEHVILQKNKTFVSDGKHVKSLLANVGDVISFENGDPFFHNIFSLSGLESFDLGSYPKGQSKSIKLSKSGKLEIECAIHPEMFLEVTVN